MLPFYLFLFVLLIGASLIRKRLGDKAMFIYAWIVIVLFCGGIDGSLQGGDITNYYNHVVTARFFSYHGYLDLSPFEKGYSAYNWVISHLFSDPQAFMFIHFGIVTALFLYFIYYNSRDKYIALVTYICLGSFLFYFTAFRQAIACAICLYGVVKLQKRKYIRAILCFIVAILFHRTAMVFLPLVFIRKINVSRRNMVLFAILYTVSVLLLERIVGFANETFGTEYGNSSKAVTGVLINILMFALLYYLMYKKIRSDSWLTSNMMNTGFNVIVLMAIASGSVYMMRFYAQVIERVAFYFWPAICGTWAYILDEKNINARYRLHPYYRLFFILFSIILVIIRFKHTFGRVYLIY